MILWAFYQAPVFTVKSKGHVSPFRIARRGNYPFPASEQQIITNYWGAYAGAQLINRKEENGLHFQAAACVFLPLFQVLMVIYLSCEVCLCTCVCVCVCVCAHLQAKEAVYMICINIFIHSSAPFLSLFFCYCLALCIVHVIPLFWLSVPPPPHLLSEKPMNGRKIITITHIIETSLWQAQLQCPFFHQEKWFHYRGFHIPWHGGSAKGPARGWDAAGTERTIKATVGIIIPTMERASRPFSLPTPPPPPPCKCTVHSF